MIIHTPRAGRISFRHARPGSRARLTPSRFFVHSTRLTLWGMCPWASPAASRHCSSAVSSSCFLVWVGFGCWQMEGLSVRLELFENTIEYLVVVVVFETIPMSKENKTVWTKMSGWDLPLNESKNWREEFFGHDRYWHREKI